MAHGTTNLGLGVLGARHRTVELLVVGGCRRTCVRLFANERVWAPDKKWADTVISEVASAPRGRLDDLCDTVSAALIYLRDRGLLSLGEEFRREERRNLVYRSRAGGPSIRELYEDL